MDTESQLASLTSFAESSDACHGTLCEREKEWSVQNGSAEVFSLPSGEISDIILDTGDKHFHCHKHILCKGSLYFNGMFMSGMLESQSSCVELHDTKTEAFRDLLHYFYTGQLELSQSNVFDLVEMSSLYQATNVLQKCSDFLLGCVDDDSCLSLMHLANTFMLNELYDKSRRHSLWHFESVSQTEDFYAASASQIIDYLQDPYLNCENEVDVFKAFCAWYQHNAKPCEVTDLANFFAKAVNFHLLTKEALGCLKEFSAVQMNEELMNFVISLSQDHILSSLKCKVNPVGLVIQIKMF